VTRSAIRPVVLVAEILYFSGSEQINTNGRPAARPFELVYTMTVKKDIKHARSKMVVSAVFQDDINVRAFGITEKCSFRHIDTSTHWILIYNYYHISVSAQQKTTVFQ